MKRLSKSEEQLLKNSNEEAYQIYYYYLRALYDDTWINNLSLEQRKKVFPFLISIIKFRNKINGYHLNILGDNRVACNKSKIFAVTHIGKADIELVSEAINEHSYLLCGDFESLHNTIDGLFLGINGVLYFNEKNKDDRKNIKRRMKEVLNAGGNILYFPEGTWNLSPNLPVNPLYHGVAEIAIETNSIIVPIAIEQYENTFIAKIGKNFDVTTYFGDNCESRILCDLRDELATLKWDIWSSVSPLVRQSIPTDYYSQFLDDRIGEWPTLTLEDFTNAIYKDKNIVSPDEVFEPIKQMYKKL